MGAKKVINVTAQSDSTCVILEDRTLYCWGRNNFGQLGYGDQQHRLQPQRSAIPLGQPVVQVAIDYHTCALLQDGSVKCWGSNGNGELGYGDFRYRFTPGTEVLPLQGKRALFVAVFYGITCIIIEEGHVQCWGRNERGDLGYGDYKPRIKPGESIQLQSKRATHLDIGEANFILMEDGSIQSWGSGMDGRLGYGFDTSFQRYIKRRSVVNLGKKAIKVSNQGGHTCAILEDKSLKCWGDNTQNKLGYGNTQPELYGPPDATVPLTQKVLQVTTGGGQTCALLSDFTVRCWGRSKNDGLGHDPLRTPLFESPTQP
ncbi:MAG: hypothetical protein AAGJ35_01275 [Myxococcota bacterium]